jgi:2,3-bisphosphoglycerate-independent phosphoglycerate mutase
VKYIIVVPDGASDLPSSELDGKTPFEVCKLTNLNYFAKMGKVGTVRTIPSSLPSVSSVGMLSLLGYDPKEFFTGVAPLAAAHLGIKLEHNEVAFECYFVTESEGKLADYSAGRLTSKEARILINHLNKKLANDFIHFFPGSGHRHIVVIKDSQGLKGLSAECEAPFDVMGDEIKKHLPRGKGAELLSKIMLDAREILKTEEINDVRVDLGENPANMIWLWGQGETPHLPRFIEKFGLTGALISALDEIKGIARLIGLTVVDVAGSTGHIDTDYEAKAKAALEALEEKDLVIIHVDAASECSRERKLRSKISAVESVDHFILKAVRKYIEKHPDTRVLVAPAHSAPCGKKASDEAVPFAMFGQNVAKDEVELFSEATCKLSSLQLKHGHELMTHFLGM